MKETLIQFKTDKDIPPSWAVGQSDETIKMKLEIEDVEIKTFTQIYDVWRKFYTTDLKTTEERTKLKKMLRNSICDCDDTFEKELKRMNQLAKATKGDLFKD